MSVYIPMEMPTSCAECALNYDYFKCIVTGTPFFDHEHHFDDETARLDNCPLVPVPPHGRLIDADALIGKMHDECLFDYDARSVVYADIQDAPTIIPADPADKEGER